MTQRERQASGTEGQGLAGTAATLAAGPGAPPPDGAGPGRGPHRPLSWENLFLSISPAQQQELLALAGRQGLVYSHQVPVPGHPPRSPSPPENAAPQLLSRLLAGQVANLEPVRVRPVTFSDQGLLEGQREAVARALATPDVCLIQGFPGTGKSRVVTEIITQAAAQGWRVLFLAPGAAALDRVLESLGHQEAVCALRCLGPQDKPEDLAPAVRALTFPERVRWLAERSLLQAQAAVGREEQNCRRYPGQEPLWAALEELAGRFHHLEGRGEELVRQRAECPGEVEREARELRETGPAQRNGLPPDRHAPAAAFAAALGDCFRAHQEVTARTEAGRAEVSRLIEERREELAKREPELEALRPLVEAKRKGRWWTWTWWRATFKGKVPSRWAALEDLQKQAREAIAGLEERARELGQERARADETLGAEQARLVGEETARRLAELEDQEKALRQEQNQLRDKWQSLCQELGQAGNPPERIEPGAVRAAREAWQQQREHDEGQLAFAREWSGYLRGAASTLAERLPDYINVVAATTNGLSHDEHFGQPSGRGAGFDLLVLEEAERVTEAELLQLARRARRWILIGAPAWEDPPEEREQRPAKGRTASRALAPAPTVFQKLWQNLHCDPRQFPYTWAQEDGRLCCRLRPVLPDQRRWLETERVADSPDIELRILVMPHTQPLLAEVVFPPSATIQQAKEFIFRELEELAVQASSPSLRWTEEAEKVVLRLADHGAEERVCVHLAPGICEKIARLPRDGAPWQTCRVEFDRGAGWQRERAEDWIRRHLGVRVLGRTVCLDVSCRQRAPLAAFLADLFEGTNAFAPVIPDGAAESGRVVEFVPVPPFTAAGVPPPRGGRRAQANGSRVAAPPAPRSVRGGAGLELDLATPRHGDRLPNDLRALLPSQGLVNFFEAQAVVRRLEALAAEFQKRTGRGADGNGPPFSVAVAALYPAQAQLIRLLVEKSARLSGGHFPVEVGEPNSFRHREVSVLLLSLTRSHSHRAVSYGEGPLALALALTRVRERLILFGDPGTLARRTRWEGPVDHLDDVGAGRERNLLARLVPYLHGQGRHQEVFHLSEGGGP